MKTYPPTPSAPPPPQALLRALGAAGAGEDEEEKKEDKEQDEGEEGCKIGPPRAAAGTPPGTWGGQFGITRGSAPSTLSSIPAEACGA